MGSENMDWSNRRSFIGGSDARIIMGDDEAALVRLWREKRGEAEHPDFSDNLIVQLGLATEALNRRWYEQTTGQAIQDVQKRIRHPVLRWMGATLDGILEGTGAVSVDRDAGGRKEMGRAIGIGELRGAKRRDAPFIDDGIQLQQLQLFDHD